GDHGRQHGHRVRAGRIAFEELLHVLVQEAVAGEALAEVGELGLARQVAVDQQEAHLREPRLAGDLFDGVAAVAQDPLLAVDEGDGALAGAGVAVALVERDRAALGAELRNIDTDFALAAHDDGKLVVLAVKGELRRRVGVGGRSCFWIGHGRDCIVRLIAPAMPWRPEGWRPASPGTGRRSAPSPGSPRSPAAAGAA